MERLVYANLAPNHARPVKQLSPEKDQLMFKSIRNAYAAGYRTGRSGKEYTLNPHKNIILRVVWDNGWSKGMWQALNQYFKARGVR